MLLYIDVVSNGPYVYIHVSLTLYYFHRVPVRVVGFGTFHIRVDPLCNCSCEEEKVYIFIYNIIISLNLSYMYLYTRFIDHKGVLLCLVCI